MACSVEKRTHWLGHKMRKARKLKLIQPPHLRNGKINLFAFGFNNTLREISETLKQEKPFTEISIPRNPSLPDKSIRDYAVSHILPLLSGGFGLLSSLRSRFQSPFCSFF